MTFISAGYVRRRDGEQSNWKIPEGALIPAVQMFNGVANFIDHASLATWFYPQIKDMGGVCFGAKWNAERRGIDGGLRLSARPDLAWYQALLDEYLEDQEDGHDVPDVGLSAVLYQDAELVDGDDGKSLRQTTKIKYVESCDTVFGPGAEGRLREALQSISQFISLPASLGGSQNGGIDPMKFCSQCGARWAEGHACPTDEQPQILNPPAAVLSTGGSAPAAPVVSLAAAAAPAQLGQSLLGADNGLAAYMQPILAQLERQNQELTRLNAVLARAEESNVVEGLSLAPRDPAPGMRISGMLTGLDRFSPAVDWLFGVPDTPYPDPQFRRADQIYQALTGDWEWRGMFSPDRVMLAGASTITLPGLAVNAMNKVIQLLWASLRQYRWYEFVTAVVPNDGSTQPMQWIGTGGVGVLPVVAERGVYTELDIADTKEADDFVKYGGYVGISIEMFRRSQIAKIQAAPNGLARSAVMTRSSKIASIFTANSGVGPTLDQDSVALFHSSHSNVAATAFGTDSTAWNAVDLEIWSHPEIGSGKPIGVSPKFMLCRRNLYRAALVVFGYGDGQPTTYVPEALDRGPDDPRPFPLAVPDFSDTNDWAAIADPQVYPVIGMSYAQATQGNTHPLPEVFSVVDPNSGLVFSNDILPIKVRDWFSYGVNGYRGIAKRNVA